MKTTKPAVVVVALLLLLVVEPTIAGVALATSEASSSKSVVLVQQECTANCDGKCGAADDGCGGTCNAACTVPVIIHGAFVFVLIVATLLVTKFAHFAKRTLLIAWSLVALGGFTLILAFAYPTLWRDVQLGTLSLVVVPMTIHLVLGVLAEFIKEQDTGHCEFTVSMPQCPQEDAVVVTHRIRLSQHTERWLMFFSCRSSIEESLMGGMVLRSSTASSYRGQLRVFSVTETGVKSAVVPAEVNFESCSRFDFVTSKGRRVGQPIPAPTDCSGKEDFSCISHAAYTPRAIITKNGDEGRVTIVSRRPIVVDSGRAYLTEQPDTQLPFHGQGLSESSTILVTTIGGDMMSHRPHASMAFSADITVKNWEGQWLTLCYSDATLPPTPHPVGLDCRPISFRLYPKCQSTKNEKTNFLPLPALHADLLQCSICGGMFTSDECEKGETKCDVLCSSMNPLTRVNLVHSRCTTEVLPVIPVLGTKAGCIDDIRPHLTERTEEIDLCPPGYSVFASGTMCCSDGQATRLMLFLGVLGRKKAQSQHRPLWTDTECSTGDVMNCPWPNGCIDKSKLVSEAVSTFDKDFAKKLREKGIDVNTYDVDVTPRVESDSAKQQQQR